MKKLISSLVLSIAIFSTLALAKDTFAANACAYATAIADCSNAVGDLSYIVPVCDTPATGYVCARDGGTGGTSVASCSCQKAFGAGLVGQRNLASLSNTSVPAIIGSVIKVILGISGTVALIFIIWGGIKWMISKGEEKEITNARKLMTSGMVGIAIIAAAYAITDFVIKQIGVVAGA